MKEKKFRLFHIYSLNTCLCKIINNSIGFVINTDDRWLAVYNSSLIILSLAVTIDTSISDV